MKKMLKGAFAAAAMVTLAAGLSAADKKTVPAPAADSKSNIYAVTFTEIDADKNGKVTLNEYTVYWAKPDATKKAEAAQNKDVKAQQETFKKIDKNGDNVIAVDEYTAFYAAPAAKPEATAPAAPAKK